MTFQTFVFIEKLAIGCFCNFLCALTSHWKNVNNFGVDGACKVASYL